MAIIRGKFFTLTPTSKVDIISNPGKRLTLSGEYSPPTIIGGDETTITENNVIYKVHTFTATGILTVTSADNNIASVEYLVLAGGGGGGSPGAPAGVSGGGGGAGGFRTGSVSLGVTSYVINIGAGGAANVNGEDSFIGGSPTGPYTLLSNGGGAGGGYIGPGDPGGSGGGGSGGEGATPGGPGIPGQGFPGGTGQPATFAPGRLGGGGGGAGGAGVYGGSGAAGGIGVYNSFTGQPVYYAFGGNGRPTTSGPGPSNSGAGGGGGGAAGGSGIVIIRYRI